mmetsp:Transcript_23519/g.32991  ORF Transcript_23519/g.32991 Transcript_23519/m.32991 type:complete len:410 (+) Transcript_23519:54-1283(+)
MTTKKSSSLSSMKSYFMQYHPSFCNVIILLSSFAVVAIQVFQITNVFKSNQQKDLTNLPPVFPPPPHHHHHQFMKKNNHNFTAAICALVVDAEMYLMEWLDYHLALGFEEIFLYDNSENFELKQWYQNTRSHPIYSRVHIKHLPGKGWLDEYEHYGGYTQNVAYTHCIKKRGKRNSKKLSSKLSNSTVLQKKETKHDFFALIDLDEFIVLKQYGTNHSVIQDVIAEYLEPYGGALTMNWQLFGTSNKSTYSPVPLLRRNLHRDPEPDNVIKVIVQSTDFVAVKNPHNVEIAKGKEERTTLFPGALHSYANGVDCRACANDQQKPKEVVLVHHYRYGSLKEYTQKACVRGEVVGGIKGCNEETGKLDVEDWPDHVRIRRGQVYDDSAWKFLIENVPKYRVFDEIEWTDYF